MENNDKLIKIAQGGVFLTATKRDIEDVVSDTAAALNDGFMDHADAMVVGKKLDELAKKYNEAVRQLGDGKLNLQKGVPYVKHGVSFEEAETGVSYDYSTCGCSEWDDLNEKVTYYSEKKKAREAVLKTIRKETADLETGEIIKPPIRKGKLGYKLTFKN